MTPASPPGRNGEAHHGGRAAWRNATISNPCPKCAKPDYCSVSQDGDWCCCRRVAEGAHAEKQDANGALFWTHRLTPWPQREGAWDPPRCSLADGKGERAGPEVLDRLYSALLEQLPLTGPHAEALERRGLARGELASAGYGTLGKSRARAAHELVVRGHEKHLPTVPGFFVQERNGRTYWTLAGPGGPLIPVRDEDARIVALMVRRDDDAEGSKYLFLSSKKRGGPGPGAPVHVPRFRGDKTLARVTEGPLKADIATRLSGIITVGLPGVSASRRAARVLKKLGAKTVRVAFDADCWRNRSVAGHLQRLVQHLCQEGFGVELEAWDEADGKGIDDLLRNGKTPRVLTGDAIDAEVRDILAAAAKADPPPASEGGPAPGWAAPKGEALEAEDDPHRLARLYVADHMTAHGSTMRWWRDEFFRWDGCSYRPLPDKEVKAELSERIKREFDERARAAVRRWDEAGGAGKKGKPVPAPVALRVTARLVADVVQALQGMTVLPGTVEPPMWLAAAPFPAAEVLSCRNTLVHLPSWAAGADCRRPLTPALFSLAALDYDFDPAAPTPRAWLGFLEQLWEADRQVVEALQEFFGYCLLSDTSQQKILMIVGPKRSGKGTIARVLRALVGVQNSASPTLASLGTNFGLAPLLGKTVAVVSDARLSGRTDVAVVVERLLSISGEDAQSIDRKFKAHVTATLPVRFVILTNELPRLNDSSGALVGRLVVLRQTRSWYGREDTGLTARLLAELPGILLWALAGWKRLRARGRFEQPNSALQLVEDLEDLSSPVGAFLREECEVGPGFEVPTKALFAAWKSWCEQKGRREHGTEQVFGRDLRAAVPGVDDRRPIIGGVKTRVYAGLRLRPWDDAKHEPQGPFG